MSSQATHANEYSHSIGSDLCLEFELAEAESEEETVMHLDPKHFELLRIAKLRNLKVRALGSSVYAVTSHTRRADGVEWVVSDGVCSCPSRSYCTHASAAVDFYFINQASPSEYVEYTKEVISDRTQLRLRLRADELTKNDKTYLAYCMKVYSEKRRAAKLSVPPITETVVRQGTRTRKITRCGSFTI